jgi:hypothetical protein
MQAHRVPWHIGVNQDGASFLKIDAFTASLS